MSLFPRTSFYGPDASFTPLFRLLDDFENYRGEVQGTNTNDSQVNPARQQVRAVRSFTPKFDVRETANAYELHGELPGIEKDNVHIDFTEPQTLVIRGRIERSYTNSTSENSENGHAVHKATVEDDPTEKKSTEVVKSDNNKKEVQKAPTEKYWVSERSIGEFSRTFNFPTRVDQDAVQANLKDGLLTVVIPKAKKHESRRIAIN